MFVNADCVTSIVLSFVLLLCCGWWCQAAKVAKRLKTGTVSGYTDASNPFGDSNLTEK